MLASQWMTGTYGLEAKKALIESLQLDNGDLLNRLKFSQKDNKSNYESYQLEKEVLMKKENEDKHICTSLLVENTQAAETIEKITSQNNVLVGSLHSNNEQDTEM